MLQKSSWKCRSRRAPWSENSIQGYSQKQASKDWLIMKPASRALTCRYVSSLVKRRISRSSKRALQVADCGQLDVRRSASSGQSEKTLGKAVAKICAAMRFPGGPERADATAPAP